MVKLVVLAAALVIAGCNSREIQLDPKFLPLTSVREVSDNTPILKAGFVATVYSTSYTKSLRELVDAYPVGSVGWDALFFHERMHAIREYADPLFLVKYATDPAFRWQEEKLGYREEIRYLRDNGGFGWNDVIVYSKALSTGYAGMVTWEEAEDWIHEVLQER